MTPARPCPHLAGASQYPTSTASSRRDATNRPARSPSVSATYQRTAPGSEAGSPRSARSIRESICSSDQGDPSPTNFTTRSSVANETKNSRSPISKERKVTTGRLRVAGGREIDSEERMARCYRCPSAGKNRPCRRRDAVGSSTQLLTRRAPNYTLNRNQSGERETNSTCLQRRDRRDLVAQRAPLQTQLVVRLQVHPELLRRSEVTRQTNRGVRGDPPRAMHDLVDSTRRHPDRHGELVLRDREAFDEVLHQDLPRVDRLDQLRLSASRRVRHLLRLHLSRRSRDAIARSRGCRAGHCDHRRAAPACSLAASGGLRHPSPRGSVQASAGSPAAPSGLCA